MTAQVKGFDISSWNDEANPNLDFAEAKKAGFSFVIIKSSQGQSYVNPKGKANAVKAHEAGLLVGAYHYAEPAENTAELEALHALGSIAGWPLSLGLSMDLEELGSLQTFNVGQWGEQFVTHIATAGHIAPAYLDGEFLTMMSGAPWGHRLWFASPEIPVGIKPWIHQTGTGEVPGIGPAVDLDVLLAPRGVNPSAPAEPVKAAPEKPEPHEATAEHSGANGDEKPAP